MKKLTPIIVIGIVVLSGLGAVAQPVTENTLEKVTLQFSEPSLQHQNNYISVSLTEANSFLMRQDKPLLPCYTKTFTYPFGTTIHSVTVTPQTQHMQTLATDVEPTPQQVIIGQDEIANPASSVAYGPEPYPSGWFDYSVGCGRYEGALSIIVNVEIYPVRYYPSEKIIRWTDDVDIVIDYEPSTPPSQQSSRDTYELVVIAPAEYSSQLSPLVTHKIGRGISTKFVSLDEIYGGTYFPATGRDNQEKIKNFIKNTIESWTTANILLVGSASKLPARETHVHVGDDDYEIFVSDLYYADIYNKTGGFSSWDTNGNSIFGEYDWYGNTDKVDLHPDVYLGRLAATSTAQVTSSVNKIITYETTPGYQQSWFQNLVIIGGDSFEDDDQIKEGEYANDKVVEVMVGFTPTYLNVTNGLLTGFTPTGTANIKSTINNGCGFIDFSGHGNTNVWATHPYLNFNQWVPTPAQGFYTNDILSLTNGNKLPIVTVEACSTAKFNNDPNCFNWAFVYSSSGGAIGTFGCAGLGYGYIGDGVTTGLIGKIGLDTYKGYILDKATTFGGLWARALERYIKTSMTDGDYKTVEEWQSFGDPTLAIAEESLPPAKPITPNGPTAGKVGTEYTYTTSTTDPEGDKISYMFDWGDGTLSGWVGPLNSGSTASAKKTWTSTGTFKVKVIAKDSHGVYSNWSDSLTVVLTGSSFVLQNVQGGLFKISAQIKNTGDDPVSNINWNITLTGGAFIGAKSSGVYTSSIPVDSNGTIQSGFILGLGATSIKIQAWINDGPSATITKSGTILLFFIKVNA